LGLAADAYGDDWKDQRCREIQSGVASLEQRAPEIREQIAKLENELGRLQSFQGGGQTIYLSTVINHVPGVAVAVVGSLTGMRPEFANELVNRTGDLQAYVNQREIRVRKTELPALQEEQTDVGRRIFLLRDERDSLKCSETGEIDQSFRRIVGEWKIEETEQFARIEPEGRGMLLETMENTYGFEEGDIFLTNFGVDGEVIKAELTIRASKEDCPSLNPRAVPASIKVQPDSNTFTLTAANYSYCTTSCQWTDEQVGTLTRTFVRIAK
jgi:hypothetical protein